MKIVVSVIGLDCPGIVYAVSDTLSGLKCSIDALTQTILQGQFAAIFVVSIPDSVSSEEVRSAVSARINQNGMHMNVTAHPFEQNIAQIPESEPFVVTVSGHDNPGIIASISRIFADHAVNIESLKAILPDGNTDTCLLLFEIALPVSVDHSAFRRTLLSKGEHLGLQISIQHRDIFEAMHRVSPF